MSSLSADTKLDEILKKLERLTAIEAKIDSFSNRLTKLEEKYTNKCEELDMKFEADAKIFDKFDERITALENIHHKYEKEQLMQESYNKRLNVLIHGVKEEADKVWETRDETSKKFKKFLKEGLKITDPDDIEVVDVHRLPQHPVSRYGKKIHRPIIVKLLTMQDKKLIYNSVKNLKSYNEILKDEQDSHPYVYINDHLPAKFHEQRKLLLPFYRDAKKLKQKTMWKAVDGEFCLFVNDRKVNC